MLLIITGCVNVNSEMPFVTIFNENIRLKDYMKTIDWALHTSKFRDIIFCENSNYALDITEINKKAQELGKSFEYLTFLGNSKKAIEQGKGYGEGEIVDYALTNSKLIENHQFFCKITGRLKISNIENLIRKPGNYFMNEKAKEEIDTRFYCVKKIDYNCILRDGFLNVNDNEGFFLEHVFYQELHKRKVKYRMFCERPLFEGVSGSTGRIYQDSRKKYEKLYGVVCKTNLYNSKYFWNLMQFTQKIRRKTDGTR